MKASLQCLVSKPILEKFLRVDLCGNESCRIGWSIPAGQAINPAYCSLMWLQLAELSAAFTAKTKQANLKQKQITCSSVSKVQIATHPWCHFISVSHMCVDNGFPCTSLAHCVVFLALISLSQVLEGFLCRSPLIISALKLLCKLLSSLCEQCLMGLWFPILPFLTWRNAFQSWFSIPATGK